MTDKQKTFLLKYISKESIEKLDNSGFKNISSFIKLILETKSNDFLCSTSLGIDIKYKCKYKSLDVKTLEKYINQNKEKYSDILDESFKYECSYKVPQYNKIFHSFKQTWFKGMSDSSTNNYILINDDRKFYESSYDMLIKLKIYSLQSFMNYLRNNNFVDEY